MEDVTLRMMITGIVVIVSNIASIIITLKWIRADLNKHEEVHRDYVASHGLVTKDVKEHINTLYERTSNMMSKQEIATMVKDCIKPVSEDISELKASVSSISHSVNQMSVSFARMDERTKSQHDNQSHDRRVSD
jgi:uncharacterized protein YoxC